MPIPNLLHPTRIGIRQTVPSATAYDEDAREAIQEVAQADVIIAPGQVNFREAGQGHPIQEFTRGGVDETGMGYILFRYIDLNALSIDLKPNDRIVSMGHLTCDLYIFKLVPTGHYPDTNGASMVKAYVRDRAPSRQSPGA